MWGSPTSQNGLPGLRHWPSRLAVRYAHGPAVARGPRFRLAICCETLSMAGSSSWPAPVLALLAGLRWSWGLAVGLALDDVSGVLLLELGRSRLVGVGEGRPGSGRPDRFAVEDLAGPPGGPGSPRTLLRLAGVGTSVPALAAGSGSAGSRRPPRRTGRAGGRACLLHFSHPPGPE